MMNRNELEKTDEASKSTEMPCYMALPTVEQAGVIAGVIVVGLCEELEANEQAFFIAGFQECIKYLKAT